MVNTVSSSPTDKNTKVTASVGSVWKLQITFSVIKIKDDVQ